MGWTVGRGGNVIRVLVCGSRNWDDSAAIREALNNLRDEAGDLFVIEGGASGADHIARSWAIENVQPYATVPAPWGWRPRSGGPIRNAWMLTLQPDVVMAFQLRGSRGTQDMIDKARAAGVPVRLFRC